MLHIDIPSRSDIERLITVRTPACVSIYLGTSPITQDAQKSRIELKNLARTGLEQLRAKATDRRVVAAIEEAIDDLIDDDDFWRFQANSSRSRQLTPHPLLALALRKGFGGAKSG